MDLSTGDEMIRNYFKCRLIETRRRHAHQAFLPTDPEISVRGHGHCSGARLLEAVEVFAVETNEIVAIETQPKKTVFTLDDLIYHRSRKTVVGGEMRTDKAACRKVRVKREDRSTQRQNPHCREYQVPDVLYIVHDG